MSLILNIDTSLDTAFVNIAEDGIVMHELGNTSQKDHASFLQPAVKELARQAGIQLSSLDAIAVAAGPGSYTGLRVGMASAKGLCYALKKPLITVGTLEIIAAATIKENADKAADKKSMLFAPMIDARRMEVFTAVFDEKLSVVEKPSAMILNENSFCSLLQKGSIIFSGNGADKWKKICAHPNAFFSAQGSCVGSMAVLSFQKASQKEFADLVYSDPDYIKAFQSNAGV